MAVGDEDRHVRTLSCLTDPQLFPCRESIVSLKRKYLKNEVEEGVSLGQPSMDGILDAIAKEGCSSLLEEVFLDLEVGHAGCAFELSAHLLSSSVTVEVPWLSYMV